MTIEIQQVRLKNLTSPEAQGGFVILFERERGYKNQPPNRLKPYVDPPLSSSEVKPNLSWTCWYNGVFHGAYLLRDSVTMSL